MSYDKAAEAATFIKSKYAADVAIAIVLGSGRPLFLDKVDSFGLKLMEAKTFDLGSVQLKYKPKKTAAKR